MLALTLCVWSDLWTGACRLLCRGPARRAPAIVSQGTSQRQTALCVWSDLWTGACRLLCRGPARRAPAIVSQGTSQRQTAASTHHAPAPLLRAPCSCGPPVPPASLPLAIFPPGEGHRDEQLRHRLFSEILANNQLYPDFAFLEKNV